MTVVRKPLAERLWAKVEKTATCWLWTASVDVDGYGQIGLGGRNGGKGKAHRVSYELANGHIPAGMSVLHNCPGADNPRCVNPAHLRLGSQIDNMADRQTKGRHNNGNSVKAACKNGHPFTDENTVLRGARKQRICRACAAAKHREKYPLKPATATGKACSLCALMEPAVRFPKAGNICTKCEYIKTKAKRGVWNKQKQSQPPIN